jgi:hypothetical protein
MVTDYSKGYKNVVPDIISEVHMLELLCVVFPLDITYLSHFFIRTALAIPFEFCLCNQL